MLRAKTWYFIAALAVALTMSTMPVVAWELNLGGSYNWEWEWRSQSGTNGFFGAYDADIGSGFSGTGVYAPYNAWLGWAPQAYIVSGSDAAWQTAYMDIYPELRINAAVRVRGRYHVGEWFDAGAGLGSGNLVASEALNYRYGGVQRSFSPGYWNTLWLTAQLPWGEVAFGKRPSSFGTGLGWNGTESRSSESLNLSTFYGPLRISMSCYPARRLGTATTNYFNPDYDKNNGRLWDIVIPSVTYRNGPIDVGGLLNIVSGHQGGEGRIVTPAARITGTTYFDRQEYYGAAYLKYYNGNFFFNAEVDFDSITLRNRRKAAVAGAAGSFTALRGIRDTYTEHWRAMAEAAILAGPAKLSLLYAWSPGDDRRGGQFTGGAQGTNFVTYIDRRSVLNSDSFANTGLFRPYSYLMVYTYGMGMFVNSETGNGYVEDASVWAGRLDYAVAANLHVFGSFMYAERQSKSGFGWGCLSPSVTNTAGAFVTSGIVERRFGTSNTDAPTNFRADRVGAPNIPDTGLGWEVDAGFQWRLLEGFSANLTFGYWQPGNWFKWACVDKGVPGWYAPAATPGSTVPLAWGINPDRAIDPIYGIELVVKGEF